MRKHGQESLLHQPDVLASALAAPLACFGAHEPYPTDAEKLVRLADGLSRAQAFNDGNKRLALVALIVTMSRIGWKLTATQQERAHWIEFDLSTKTKDDTQKAVDWLEANSISL